MTVGGQKLSRKTDQPKRNKMKRPAEQSNQDTVQGMIAACASLLEQGKEPDLKQKTEQLLAEVQLITGPTPCWKRLVLDALCRMQGRDMHSNGKDDYKSDGCVLCGSEFTVYGHDGSEITVQGYEGAVVCYDCKERHRNLKVATVSICGECGFVHALQHPGDVFKQVAELAFCVMTDEAKLSKIGRYFFREAMRKFCWPMDRDKVTELHQSRWCTFDGARYEWYTKWSNYALDLGLDEDPEEEVSILLMLASDPDLSPASFVRPDDMRLESDVPFDWSTYKEKEARPKMI